MKKNILFYYAGFAKQWMGGIYYIKNILFQLSIAPRVREKYHIYLCINEEIIGEFQSLQKDSKIQILFYDQNPESLLEICSDYNIDAVLPVTEIEYSWLIKDICLYWIPDFQEIFYPENFSDRELKRRKWLRKYIAEEHRGLILSSNDSYHTYKMLYPKNTENVFIVHFISCIGSVLDQITDSLAENVLKKYGLVSDYIFVANQFWKHKNHIVVLEALNRIVHVKQEEIHLVCTGFMSSYAEENEYVGMLFEYIEKNSLTGYVHFLGLLERNEQLCIMKNARLLIQPSKFEGWGCSVEDAKVMGKVIVLSDIDVHKEQQYPKSILFPQDDSEALAEIIMKYFRESKKYDLEYGNCYTMEKAEQYSEELQSAIDSLQGNDRGDYLSKLYRLRKEKVRQLFGNLPANQICIYGVGKYTEKILESCRMAGMEINFIYTDSDPEKWGQNFYNQNVYSPQEIPKLGVKRIVISSYWYQEEIYQTIRKFEWDIETVKIFESEEERYEALWL